MQIAGICKQLLIFSVFCCFSHSVLCKSKYKGSTCTLNNSSGVPSLHDAACCITWVVVVFQSMDLYNSGLVSYNGGAGHVLGGLPHC